MTMKQSEAVVQITLAVLADRGIEVEAGVKVTDYLNDAMRLEIKSKLVKGFNEGKIKLESPQKNIESYTTGLMNNHFNKSTKLNGGVKYEPKNPGSRSTDPRLKALHALQEQFSADEEKLFAINVEIAAVTREIEAKRKPAAKAVDLSVLGEEFLAKLG